MLHHIGKPIDGRAKDPKVRLVFHCTSKSPNRHRTQMPRASTQRLRHVSNVFRSVFVRSSSGHAEPTSNKSALRAHRSFGRAVCLARQNRHQGGLPTLNGSESWRILPALTQSEICLRCHSRFYCLQRAVQASKATARSVRIGSTLNRPYL